MGFLDLEQGLPTYEKEGGRDEGVLSSDSCNSGV